MSILTLARTICRALRASDYDAAIIAYFALRERVEPEKAHALLRWLMRRCGWS